ncbi:hypothetical protein LCGC14_2609640, partial [marine sediment metagenome]
ALVLAIGLRWSALSAIFTAGWVVTPLLLAAILSRVPMVALGVWLPAARNTGASALTGRPRGSSLLVAAGLGFAAATILAGWAGLVAGLMAGAIAWGWGMVAKTKLGGQTGDILGASQQLTEIAVLTVLAASVSHVV